MNRVSNHERESATGMHRSMTSAESVRRSARIDHHLPVARVFLLALLWLACLLPMWADAPSDKQGGDKQGGDKQGGEKHEGEKHEGEHDMLMLLPDGPIHLRLRITDGGKPLKRRREEYLQQLATDLDADQDGKISRSETANHPLFTSGRRFEGNTFLNSLRSRRPYTDREIEMAVNRSAGQLVSYRQNNALADQDLSVFRVLDADESGLIERVEMRLAAARIAERDSDFDQCVTFDEFLNDAASMTQDVVVTPLGDEPPGAIHSELLRDANEPILAARLVRRYDKDRDAQLTAGELGWQPGRLSRLDADGDSKLSIAELSNIPNADPDLSLRVDLASEAAEAMRVVGQPSADVETPRADLVRLLRGGLSLSIGYRHRDPLQEAKQNAAVGIQCD